MQEKFCVQDSMLWQALRSNFPNTRKYTYKHSAEEE